VSTVGFRKNFPNCASTAVIERDRPSMIILKFKESCGQVRNLH
jgi:hypothetical protein